MDRDRQDVTSDLGLAREAPGTVTPGDSLARGAELGRYVILHAIGSGAAGNVYAAYDPELDRKVAVKLLSAHALASPGSAVAEARLRREARAAARLAHPNVVRIYDVGRAGDRVFVTMELLEGQTLRAWLDERPRAWREIVRVFHDAGRGLAAVHTANVVHRDFKPSNVMLDPDDRVVLLDFGLARLWREVAGEVDLESGEILPDADPTGGSRLTGGAVGTPRYMAPEQARGEAVDPRADQYAFCIALAEALEATHGRWLLRRGPARLRRFLRRGTSDDPDERFDSFEELLDRLAETLHPYRRSLAAAAVVIALATGATFWWTSAHLARCTGAEDQLTGVWDAGVRAAARRAFLHSEQPFRDRSWALARETLDRFAREWVSTHTATCEATHVQKEQSELLLDVKMECLQRHLDSLRSVGRLFVAADDQIVRDAPRIASSVGDPGDCETLSRPVLSPLALSPELEVEIRTVRGALTEAKVHGVAGRLARALEIAREADRDAARIGFEPLIAETKYQLGTLLGRNGDRPGQREALLAALTEAVASGHEEYVARVATDLIVAAVMRGDADEAAAWSTVAEGAIERFGGHREIAARRLLFLGMLSQLRGDGAEAIRYYEAWLVATPDPGPVERGSAETNTGIAYLRQNLLDEAEGHLLRGRRLLEEGYGPGHPEIAAALLPLGEIEMRRNRAARAFAIYAQAEELTRGRGGADDRSYLAALAGRGRAALELRRLPEAIDALERATDRLATKGGNPTDIASWRFDLARALWEEGADRQRALDLARTAHDALVTVPPGREGERQRVERWLADRRAAS